MGADSGPATATGEGTPVAADACAAFAMACLVAAGIREDVAEPMAAQLIDAERHGYGSHGLMRLPMLVAAVRAGVIEPDPQPRVRHMRPGVALIRADRAPGAFAGAMAVREARRIVRQVGVAAVGIERAHYTGYLSYFTRPVAADGLVAIMTSATPPMTHPHGGRDPLLGSTPFSLAFPANPHPVVVDFATSAGARGRIMNAARRGEEIPTGWAIDSDGRPTVDPEAALAGTLSTFGGHKGSAFAVSMTLLASPLVGLEAPLAEGPDVFKVGSTERGDLLLLLDPAVMSGADAAGLATEFGDRLRASRPAAGGDRVRVPGDRAAEAAAASDAAGGTIVVEAGLASELTAVAAGLGVAEVPW